MSKPMCMGCKCGIDGEPMYIQYPRVFWDNSTGHFTSIQTKAPLHPSDDRFGKLCLRLFEEERERMSKPPT